MKTELHSGLGPEIAAHLQTYCDLPATGVVAGGAVADWFLGREPADVDVFVNATNEDFDRALHGIATVQYVLPDVSQDCYSDRLFLSSKDSYRVVTTSRDGMLNLVACAGENLSAPVVMSGFDLNCTQVGIDLETKRLFWSKEFAFFLKTRQLQVSTLYTPAHTALRYFNKKMQLGCFGNDDLEMEILATAFHRQAGDRRNEAYCPRLRFGRKFVDMYQIHRSSIQPYFDLVKLPFFWGLTPRTEPASDFRAIRNEWRPCYRMVQARVLREARMRPYRHSAANMETITSSLSRDAGAPLDCAEALGRWYARGQVTKRATVELSAVIREHKRLGAALFGLTLADQVAAKRRISARAKQAGPWVWGIVETEACALDISSDENLDALLSRCAAMYVEELTAPLEHLPRTVFGLTVKELTSRRALLEEGEAMRHCVGGYASDVRRGHHRIISVFHPDKPTLRSTIELVRTAREGPPQWCIGQHAAWRNQTPPPLCQLAAVWIELVVRSEGNGIKAFWWLVIQQLRLRWRSYRLRIAYRIRVILKLAVTVATQGSWEETDDIPF